MKIPKLFLLAAVALMGVACESDPDTPVDPTPDGDGYAKLELKASTNSIVADGVEKVTFTVLGDGADVTEQATIYDTKTKEEVADKTFATTTPGTYSFYATVGTQETETIIITAHEAGSNPSTGYTTLELKASSEYIVADGEDQITFTVLGDGVDITSQATIYDNKTMQEVKNAVFSTTTPGTHTFWAAVGTQYTEKIKITALEHAIPEVPADPQPDNFNFAHRTLVTQFTGTGCPNCPTMTDAIKTVVDDPEYTDKFYWAKHYSYPNGTEFLVGHVLSDAFGINGYPFTVVGYEYGIQNKTTASNAAYVKASIDECLKRSVKTGIAVNSQLTDNTLTVNAEIKAAEAGNYSIGCIVLEDGLKAYQAAAGNVTHDHVMRIESNPVIGNVVGEGEMQKGETAGTLFTYNFKNSWVQNNCYLILFVCYHSIEDSAYYIDNVITAKLNESKAYEYK